MPVKNDGTGWQTVCPRRWFTDWWKEKTAVRRAFAPHPSFLRPRKRELLLGRTVGGHFAKGWARIGTWMRRHPPADWDFCPIDFSCWNSGTTPASAHRIPPPNQTPPKRFVGCAFHSPRAQRENLWSTSKGNGTLQPNRDCWFGTEKSGSESVPTSLAFPWFWRSKTVNAHRPRRTPTNCVGWRRVKK